MDKTDLSYCDAPTVPELQQTQPEYQAASCLPENFILKGYKIQKVIAKSHGSISYMALDLSRGERAQDQVVIKEYYPHTLTERKLTGEVVAVKSSQRLKFEKGKHSFLKEAYILMRVDYAGIVQVESVFATNGTVYMAMPYHEGETLFAKFGREGAINQQGLLDIFFSLTESLSFIHDRGYLHRDLKPSNIFIQNSGQLIILDFGGVILKSRNKRSCTPVISQGYTPIEQYSTNTVEQGVWTDIYALAAVLYKGITGLPPVDAVTRGQKIIKELDDPYKPLVSIASSQYSLRFLSAVDHALCFRAEDRPQSIADWRAEFEGSAPVWLAAESVRQDLLHQAAKRLIDFDLNPS